MTDTNNIQNGLTCLAIKYINPYLLQPSPENKKIYRPVRRDDPEVISLAEDIRKNGLLDPIVVSKDGFIISGHRRREAAILAGLKSVPCRTLDIVRGDEYEDASDEFLNLLTSGNRQRVKNNAEMFREAIIQTNPDEAYKALISHRLRESEVKCDKIRVGQRGRRKTISDVKFEMVEAAIRVVEENRKYWPLSDRQIHYRLLNKPPLRNSKRKSRYRNDRASYQDLCDILVRLRLGGRIQMWAIDDETRPTSNWNVHRNPQDFAREELDDFLKVYRRNLQQTQPLHIEVVAEKMTIESIISPVCGRFNIPYTIGRGYSSLPPRADIVDRFNDSGKERLLLLILGDFDPEGINIGDTLLQSIREDFGLNQAEAVRVGLSPEHIERFGLIDNQAEAKTSSARCKEFVRRYGKRVYELEALTPAQLQQILTEAIDSVIDREAFNAELDAEKKDSTWISAFRQQILDVAKDIIPELDEGY